MPTTCFSVIIAGGKGTRFWPLSRARSAQTTCSRSSSPKSLIAETVERVDFLSGSRQTLVVTVADQLDADSARIEKPAENQFPRRAPGQEHRPLYRPGGPRSGPARARSDHDRSSRRSLGWRLRGVSPHALMQPSPGKAARSIDHYRHPTGVSGNRLWLYHPGQGARGRKLRAPVCRKPLYRKAVAAGGAPAVAPARTLEQRHFCLEGRHRARSPGALPAGHRGGIRHRSNAPRPENRWPIPLPNFARSSRASTKICRISQSTTP